MLNQKNLINKEAIEDMDYVSFMGFLNETNRPPGGKDSMRRLAQNAFLTKDSNVLHSGCNTGYCSFELCHITKCHITGIDINMSMLQSANKKLAREFEPYKSLINFERGDAHTLRFNDNEFDLVMSGGSTAFMKDKEKVVSEYVRVCKPYGFVGDVFLYYREAPPQELINKINSALNISIQNWNQDYWISLYTKAGLEEYYVYDAPMPVQPSDGDVKTYCENMVQPLLLNEEAREAAVKKLYVYMSMFNENNKYLNYTVLLCRKTPEREQDALFGK